MIRRAILSVSDKSGLGELGTFLADRGVEILSTGGSAGALREAGVEMVKDVSDYTGFPEMMDGRVKTLHPMVHGGILALRDAQGHREAMKQHGIDAIDLVVVNLYPFEKTAAKGAPFNECIENIDIGGPAMIRSAAKNHAHVAVVVDPDDYQAVMNDMSANEGAVGDDLRRRLAAKAYAHTGAYDAAISNWFAHELGESFPEKLVVSGRRGEILRYGENPHQEAAFYLGGDARPGVATARQVQGKALSFNNLNDTDAAYELVAEFDPQKYGPAVAIIKHANPCGVALGSSLSDAYRKALACDPISAFGGIIALNSVLDVETAEEISGIFTEVIVAPDADNAAMGLLAKKANLRLLLTGSLPDPASRGMTLRSVAGGYLVQTRDDRLTSGELKVVTKRKPSDAEMADLTFGFTVAKHVKSNTIVYAKNGATVGVGAGQMSRIDSARLAVRKAEEVAREAGHAEPATKGSVAASDAFFPFADGLLAAAEAGVTAVIQPGGSMRDDEVIDAANNAGIAMVFTGMRHFRH